MYHFCYSHLEEVFCAGLVIFLLFGCYRYRNKQLRVQDRMGVLVKSTSFAPTTGGIVFHPHVDSILTVAATSRILLRGGIDVASETILWTRQLLRTDHSMMAGRCELPNLQTNA